MCYVSEWIKNIRPEPTQAFSNISPYQNFKKLQDLTLQEDVCPTAEVTCLSLPIQLQTLGASRNTSPTGRRCLESVLLTQSRCESYLG